MKHTKCYIPEYPRPQFVRPDWVNLNGEWKFGFGEEVSCADALTGKLPRKIRVPFSYECELSGIGDKTMHESVWYFRKISGKSGKRTYLWFEGADYKTEVYVNGGFAGEHEGAYSRFGFDITELLHSGDNCVAVHCIDENSTAYVRGKQRWEKQSHGCWYVQTTGIYKTVWLEYVNEVRLESLKLTPSLKDNSVAVSASVNSPAEDVEIKFAISYDGKPIAAASVTAYERDSDISLRLDSSNCVYQTEKWSENCPNLYDVDITVYKAGKAVDKVGSYFGLREFEACDGKLLMNGMPFYARLLLDQGYWPESGITPPDEAALVRDIELCKAMGFNGVRKHQKVEDERFLYYADIMGFAVWCELPSHHWLDDGVSCEVTRQWLEIVRQNYNHPSVITWVIFNESWGVRNIDRNPAQQNLASGLYYLTKSIDPMRPVVSNDGWSHTHSDILTIHHYEQDGDRLYAMYDNREKLTRGYASNTQPLPYARGCEYAGQPIVFSEFGGTAYVRDEDSVCWGYGDGVKNDEEYLSRFASLVKAIERMDISGYCYTQITDVEQEVNGLLKADRTPKVPLAEIAARNKR